MDTVGVAGKIATIVGVRLPNTVRQAIDECLIMPRAL